jgi:hypothetical protein
MSVHESPGPQPSGREPPASQDRRCSLRVHTRRGYGSDSSRASALATPVPCGAAPASHPPGSGTVRRGARAPGAVSLCPVRGFWYSEVVLKPTRVTFGACPLRGFPGPVKARGTRPYAGAVALLPKNRTARYRINPEPRLAAPGAPPRDPPGCRRSYRYMEAAPRMRFAPHAAARAHGAGEENHSSPGSSFVNCAIGIPSTERPEWPTSHRECQE